MEDRLLLETIERYLNGAMLEEERAYFEQLRKNTPEIDQLVVEHRLFLNQMDMFADRKNLQHTLHEVHDNLTNNGSIYEGEEVTTKGKVIQLWHRYKKVTAIAASIAGVTALFISALVSVVAPTPKKSDLQELSKKVNSLEQKTNALNVEIKKDRTKIPEDKIVTTGGTGFLIDSKGYIVTNAHVLKGSGAVVVNDKNQEFKVRIAYVDPVKDLAILKIEDDEFKAGNALPYSIKKSTIDLGEEIYTLGYPRDEIVYNMGYLSAVTGFDGDTASLQISLPANPGNSGGPVFNRNGEVVGILSTRETKAEGVVFAIKSRGIYDVVDDLKKQDSTFHIKIASNTSLRGVDRVQQIKEVQDCVYQVKVYN